MEKQGLKTNTEDASEMDYQDAELIWKTAARLQADAARRLDERSKNIASSGNTEKTIGNSLSLHEVQSIAEEAGINTEYVALALKEIEAQKLHPKAVTDRQMKWANRLLGTDANELSISRVIQATPEQVMESLKRILPTAPYNLKLLDVIGDTENLQNAMLVFEVPTFDMGMGGEDVFSSFKYNMSIPDLNRLMVSLHALGENQTEISFRADMRHGKARNLKWGGWITGILGGLGGLIGGAMGRKTGDVVSGSVLGTFLGTLFSGWLYRWAYRSGLSKSEEELGKLLSAISVDARTSGAFSTPKSPNAA